MGRLVRSVGEGLGVRPLCGDGERCWSSGGQRGLVLDRREYREASTGRRYQVFNEKRESAVVQTIGGPLLVQRPRGSLREE